MSHETGCCPSPALPAKLCPGQSRSGAGLYQGGPSPVGLEPGCARQPEQAHMVLLDTNGRAYESVCAFVRHRNSTLCKHYACCDHDLVGSVVISEHSAGGSTTVQVHACFVRSQAESWSTPHVYHTPIAKYMASLIANDLATKSCCSELSALEPNANTFAASIGTT